MSTSMTEQSSELRLLLMSLPKDSSYKSISLLNQVLTKYIKILDYVNSYNPEYKSATTVYYADIPAIRDNIQELLNASSLPEKDKAFDSVRNELQINLHALAVLINPQFQAVQPVS